MSTILPPGKYKVEGTVTVTDSFVGKITETFKGRVAKGVYKGHPVEWTKTIKVKSGD